MRGEAFGLVQMKLTGKAPVHASTIWHKAYRGQSSSENKMVVQGAIYFDVT